MRHFTAVPPFLSVAAVAIAACAMRSAAPAPPPGVRVTEYTNGHWFDGTAFAPKTMYVVGDVFRTQRPGRVDTTIDLANRWVVPPFADAHVHFAEPGMAAMYVAMFLHDGIFYVKDQSGAPAGRRGIDPLVNRPSGVDFVGANQGWTSPGGHPVEIIKQGAQFSPAIAAFIADSLDYGAAMLVDTPADVERHWPVFLAGTPKADFVKVFLISSENYARLRHDPKAEGNRGLDPALVPLITQRAHAAGLAVSAHVSTAADFRFAVDGGVDLIAHLPGQRAADPTPYLLTDADAESAAAHHVSVVTTVAMRVDTALTDRVMRDVYAHNITVLRAHHVPLLIGSDIMRGTAVTEIAALARSTLFSNLELLRLWSVETPKAIFPHRNIGELRDGYEASFLALRADPLADIRNTRAIALEVKQGVVLH